MLKVPGGAMEPQDGWGRSGSTVGNRVALVVGEAAPVGKRVVALLEMTMLPVDAAGRQVVSCGKAEAVRMRADSAATDAKSNTTDIYGQ